MDPLIKHEAVEEDPEDLQEEAREDLKLSDEDDVVSYEMDPLITHEAVEEDPEDLQEEACEDLQLSDEDDGDVPPCPALSAEYDVSRVLGCRVEVRDEEKICHRAIEHEVNVERIKSEADQLLYADHEVKENMVIGPTEIGRPFPVVSYEMDPLIKHEAVEEDPEDLQEEAREDLQLSDEDDGDVPPCPALGAEYDVSRVLGCRVEVRDARDELLCSQCGEWSLTAAHLQRHRQTHAARFQPRHGRHPTTTHIKNTSKRFVCDTLDREVAALEEQNVENKVISRRKRNQASVKNVNCVLNMSSAIPFRFSANSFRCIVCNIRFNDTEEMHEHTLKEHPNPSYNDFFRNSKVPNKKLKIDVKHLSCKLCSEEMPDFETWIEHVNSAHDAGYDKSAAIEVMPFKLKPDNYPCLTCNEVFPYFNILMQHIHTSHTDNSFCCPYCVKVYHCKLALRNHIYFRHKDVGHTCPHCKSQYLDYEQFKVHVCKKKSPKAGNAPRCDECNVVFTSPHLRRRHMIVVHGVGHQCPYCERLFTTLSIMNDHINRQHTKKISYDCSVCDKKFYSKPLLKAHTVSVHMKDFENILMNDIFFGG